MTDYTPDNWVMLKVRVRDGEYVHKILAGWSGGYLDGDSWRINSGVESVSRDGDYLLFHGSSGSTYRCHKKSYCLRMNNAHVYEMIRKKYPNEVEMLPEDTDFESIDY